MKLAGDAANGLLLIGLKFSVAPDLPDSDPIKKLAAAFVAKFKRAYGKEPNQFAAESYDAVKMAQYAFQKAGSDREKIRDAIETMTDWEGLDGNFTFSKERHSGLTKADAVIMTWKGGQFRLVDY
jgi:branched-chain amino acid transport system substrate-binding protein